MALIKVIQRTEKESNEQTTNIGDVGFFYSANPRLVSRQLSTDMGLVEGQATYSGNYLFIAR